MFICVSRADYDSNSGDSGSPVISNSYTSSGYSIHDFEVIVSGFHLSGNSAINYAVFSSVWYTTGRIESSEPECKYAPGGWLNFELCDEPGEFGPYEDRNIGYRN